MNWSGGYKNENEMEEGINFIFSNNNIINE